MKKSIFLAGALLALLCLSACNACRKDGSRIVRLVSYNVGAFSKEMEDSTPDIAALLLSLNADAAGINEVDSCNGRHGVDQLANLSAALGAGWNARYICSMPYLGGAYGNGIVTREEVLSCERVALPQEDGAEPRSCICVETPDYVFATLHLDHVSENARVEQIKVASAALKARYGSVGKPVFLSGDFNSEPGDIVIREAGRDWVILTPPSFTAPADVPEACIDYIMQLKGTGAVEVLSSEVIPASHTLSDHLPVLLEVRIAAGK